MLPEILMSLFVAKALAVLPFARMAQVEKKLAEDLMLAVHHLKEVIHFKQTAKCLLCEEAGCGKLCELCKRSLLESTVAVAASGCGLIAAQESHSAEAAPARA